MRRALSLLLESKDSVQPSLRHEQPAVASFGETGGKSEVVGELCRGRPGRGQIDEPQASGRAALHEVTLPIGRCPVFRSVRHDEPVGVEEEAGGRGAKGPSSCLSNRFARVWSFKNQDAAPVEANGEAVRWTGRDKGHWTFEGAGVARREGASVRREPQELGAARTEEPAAVQREIVDVRQRQCDRRGVEKSVWPQRAVHHRRRSGFVVEAAKGGVGAFEGADHPAWPQ